jgi:hypothetical protein
MGVMMRKPLAEEEIIRGGQLDADHPGDQQEISWNDGFHFSGTTRFNADRRKIK